MSTEESEDNKQASEDTTGQSTNIKQVNTWNMVCHLSALCWMVGVPIGNIVGPLIIWLVKKNELPSVDTNGKESLNFQISMTIYLVVSGILCLVAIGFVLLVVIAIADIVLVIIATVKVNNGEDYRYPFTIRLIK